MTLTQALELRYIPLAEAIFLDGNPKKHDIGLIAASITENGFRDPPIWDANINGGRGGIIAGNGRTEALMWMFEQGQAAPKGIAVDEQGNWFMPVVFGCDSRSEEAANRFALDHNNLTLAGGEFTALDVSRMYDMDLYAKFLGDLNKTDNLPLTVDKDDLSLLMQAAEGLLGGGGEGEGSGSVEEGDRNEEEEGEARSEGYAGSLKDKFLFPPFSVLDTRQGWWMNRKRQWVDLGIKSELGRGGDGDPQGLTFSRGCQGTNIMEIRNKLRAKLGRDPDQIEINDYAKEQGYFLFSGTSIFDPVLTELLYRWFVPKNGLVLDPFAGGSVRGVVASKLGLKYTGVELRGEQVAANTEQGNLLCQDNQPVWHHGDSRDICRITGGKQQFDFVFSCPPYADLEVYSDDPRDISGLKYDEFLEAYRLIIKEACALLKPNRFACFVVTEIRDKKGIYRGFVYDTVDAFEEAGLLLYNDAVLINQAGSLPIRVNKAFGSYRKLGRHHQNVLVFIKGDPAKIADDFDSLTMDEGELEQSYKNAKMFNPESEVESEVDVSKYGEEL